LRGNLDNWDPLLVGTLAAGREVIVVDKSRVVLSRGGVPPTVTEMDHPPTARLAPEPGRIDPAASARVRRARVSAIAAPRRLGR
jgi:hypothetical protein